VVVVEVDVVVVVPEQQLSPTWLLHSTPIVPQLQSSQQ
jgi:hypothetical protein